MPRPPRIVVPGLTYHVTARGNRGAPIYFESDDWLWFYDRIAELSLELEWRCLSYCLMTNHYHLVVDPMKPNLSEGVHRLNGTYAQRFNRRHGLRGHLFERRFHAVAVTTEVHALELSRYVVLNPVRAGLCNHPRAWPWSSYSATVGEAAAPAFLARDRLLRLFGGEDDHGSRAFAAFVESALPKRPWSSQFASVA